MLKKVFMKKDSFFEKKMSFFKMQKFLQKFFVLIQKVMFFFKNKPFRKNKFTGSGFQIGPCVKFEYLNGQYVKKSYVC